MRTFIAFELSLNTRMELSRLVNDLRPGLGRITWVKPERMHLTLKFLGEIDEHLVAPISERLTEVCASQQPVSLEAVGLGCFPNARRPRVVWVGLEGDLDGARRIQKAIDIALKDFGFQPEEREFKPHITLGRVRGPVKTELLSTEINARAGFVFGAETLSEIAFMRSVLRPEGPLYTPLIKARLGEA